MRLGTVLCTPRLNPAVEVRGSKLHNCASRLRLGVFAFLGLAVLLWRRRRFLCPNAVDPSTISSQPVVVTKKQSTRFERLIGPGVVIESVSLVRRACKDDDLLAILGIVPAIVKDNVHRAVHRINRKPLEELFGPIVNRIVVHPRGRTPVLASIVGTRDEYVEIAIAIIAP